MGCYWATLSELNPCSVLFSPDSFFLSIHELKAQAAGDHEWFWGAGLLLESYKVGK